MEVQLYENGKLIMTEHHTLDFKVEVDPETNIWWGSIQINSVEIFRIDKLGLNHNMDYRKACDLLINVFARSFKRAVQNT